MKKDNLWILIPVIAALVISATAVYLILGRQAKNDDGDQDSIIVSGDSIHYQDYLGKWISGGNDFEDLLSTRGGSLVEITSINNYRVKGMYTVITRPPDPKIVRYYFHGKFKGNKGSVAYRIPAAGSRQGTILLQGVKIEVTAPDNPDSRNKSFVRSRFHAKTTSLKETIGILNRTRVEIVKQWGAPFKVFPSGKDGVQDGYFYPTHGVMVVFEKGKNKNRVAWVDCKETVDVNGAFTGMDFKTVQAKLGWVPEVQTWYETPVHTVYELIYFIENSKVYFLSESQDGGNSRVLIFPGQGRP